MAKSSHPFQLRRSFQIEYAPAKVNYYRSERTGLSATLIQQKSPIVNGYFAVASEVHNDSGVPHTLEHLVFMGSKKYPYKGLLDTLGNKMLSSTNAWTGVDQTVYTLGTAGWEGFKTLLPVYIDHVLYPTLTEEGFLTEVYHIDGNAVEKGVVFSEMQGVENTSSSRIQNTIQKLLYGSKSAYSSETGGLMGALRVLTNDEIKEFHKSIYTPKNLNIIVTGDVDADEFLSIVQKIDDDLESAPESYVRPFVDTEPASYLAKSTVEKIEFPEVDESFGEVVISWVGPELSDQENALAVKILLRYLCEEGIGKFSSALVEISDPLATSVDYYWDKYQYYGLSLYLSSVPTKDLAVAQRKVMDILKEVLETEAIELKQLARLLERARDKLVLNVETDPGIFAETAITSFTYGDYKGADLESWTASLKQYEVLAGWEKPQWLAVLKKYFVENPSASVLGQPSKSLYESQRAESKQRTSDYKTKFGEAGLKKLQETLDFAQKKNDLPVPQEVMNEFKTPDIGKIKFIETTMATTVEDENKPSNSIQELIDADKPDDFNLDLHFEHYDSQFVSVHLLLSTRNISTELLPLVDVFLTELFSLPIKLDDGTVLDFEGAIQKLKTDTLSDSIDYGVSGDFDDYLDFQLQVRCDKYHLAIEWLQNAFFRSQFTDDRLKIILDKYLNGLPERKRSGSTVIRSSLNTTILTSRAVKKAIDIFETDEYFKNMHESLETPEGVADLKNKLETCRRVLVESGNSKAFVTGNITKIKNPVKTWAKFNPSKNAPQEIPYLRDVRSQKGIEVCNTAIITPMASSESSYAFVVGKGPIDFLDADIPAVAVCCEFLQTIEGPMWRGVRGAGLAYGANINLIVEEGLIKLQIYRGTNSGEAIKVCKQIVTDFVSGATPIEEHALEGVKNALVHSAASGVENPAMVATKNYLNSKLKGRQRGHLQYYLSKIHDVTIKDVESCFKKYFVDVFEPSSSMVFVACHTSMTDELKEKLEAMGYPVEVGPVVGVDDGESGSEFGSESGSEDEGSESEED